MGWFRKSGSVLALTVTGIRCAHCEATIKIALGSLTGVRSVFIRHQKRVEVEIAPGKMVRRSALVAAIEKHGYQVLEASDE